jgi:DNA polymerase III subunit delta'
MWRVIGQESVISLLNHGLEKNNLSHAYIITGPRHIGKMTLAIDIAEAINCEKKNPPCGKCESCLKIQQGKHADVQVISVTSESDDNESKARTEISIDDIRQIQHTVSLPPFEGKHKAFIIEGAELLSTEAANCLLKTLEEPVTQVVFILLTANTSLVLETVVSRCQKLSLNPVPAIEIEKALIADYKIEPDKASVLSRLSHGCFGWALSAAQDEKILESYCEKRTKAIDVITCNLNERFNYANTLSTQFGKDRASVFEILGIWVDLWRDMLLLKVGFKEAIINVDIESTLMEWANDNSITGIRDSIKAIQDAEVRLNQNANPRLVLEVMMLDIPARVRDIAKR